ncbi:MAG TPA: hypothetical protein VEH06_06300 [Candidatus Bathyarchaeia archaeon]|nr:hypothetical protein [Candidatus Bathyarchaeia archaeon]
MALDVNAYAIREQLLVNTVVIALAHIQQAMDIQRINLDLLDLLDTLVDNERKDNPSGY